MSYISTFSLSLLLAVLPQQIPQQANPQAATQSPASVGGVVLRAGSAPPAPLARARVVLSTPIRGVAAPTVFTMLTDDAGRFELKGVPPGPYNLIATREGFVQATKPLTLEAGAAVTNTTLDMTPTGAIAGHLRDRAGNPVVNASVQAQRYTYQDGRRALTNVQGAITNDLGEFRFFFLPPGQYVLSAVANAGPAVSPGPNNTTTMTTRALPGVPVIGQLVGGRDEPGQGFVRASLTEFLSAGIVPASMTGATETAIFFPGTPDASAAMPIDLAAGMDFRNADFVLSDVRPGRIQGRVINGVTGLPAGGAQVLLIAKANSGGLVPGQRRAVANAEGVFEFAGISPGSYDLATVVGNLPQNISSGGVGFPGGAGINPIPQRNVRDYSTDPSGMRLGARVPVDVAGDDIDNVVLTAGRGYTIKGHLTIEGVSLEESQRQINGVVVQLMPTSQDFETAAMPAPVRPDGSFTIVGVLPGTYQMWLMGATNMRSGLVYVKSATLGTVDVINPRFVIDKEPVGDLEIVVSTATGGVGATVADEKGAPVSGATVVLVPDLARRQHYDDYSMTQSRAGGAAGLGARPGDYTAYAFERIEPNSWWDPIVMQKYAGQGTPVHVDEGKTAQLRLRVIR